MVCFGLNLGLVALYATTKREVNVVQKNGKNVKKSVFICKTTNFYHLKSVAFTPFCPCFYKDDLKSIHCKVDFLPCKYSAQKAP